MSFPEEEEDSYSICVEPAQSNAAVRDMKKLLKDKTNLMKKFLLFPFDDRVSRYLDTSKPEYKPLAGAILSAFDKSASPEKYVVGVFPNEKKNLDALILVSKAGWIYGILEGVQIHEQLRKYCNMLKPKCEGRCLYNDGVQTCGGKCDFGQTKMYQVVDENFAIMYLPQFSYDNTHLRRARIIGTFNRYVYFLELETGNIRTVRNHSKFEIPETKRNIFSESSSISQFKMNNSDNMFSNFILYHSLKIVENKTVEVVGYQERTKDSWYRIVKPVFESRKTDGNPFKNN